MLLRFNLLAMAAFTQCIDVNQILCSTRRKLCNQQVLPRDKWYGQIIIYSNIYSYTALLFSASAPIKISRSFVARGCA